jgi:hypothetical protein
MAMPARRISLLAVEWSGYCPSSLDGARDATYDTIVVAQQPSESSSAFAARLVERLRRIRNEGSTLVRAALACNGRCDTEVVAARVLAVRAMLATNPHLDDSDLSMTSSESSPDVRRLFDAIRETLREHQMPLARAFRDADVAAPAAATLRRVA